MGRREEERRKKAREKSVYALQASGGVAEKKKRGRWGTQFTPHVLLSSFSHLPLPPPITVFFFQFAELSVLFTRC